MVGSAAGSESRAAACGLVCRDQTMPPSLDVLPAPTAAGAAAAGVPAAVVWCCWGVVTAAATGVEGAFAGGVAVTAARDSCSCFSRRSASELWSAGEEALELEAGARSEAVGVDGRGGCGLSPAEEDRGTAAGAVAAGGAATAAAGAAAGTAAGACCCLPPRFLELPRRCATEGPAADPEATRSSGTAGWLSPALTAVSAAMAPASIENFPLRFLNGSARTGHGCGDPLFSSAFAGPRSPSVFSIKSYDVGTRSRSRTIHQRHALRR